MRVLVVDDEAVIRHVVRKTLAREGFEVVEAADADEALDAVDREPVDVVVLDLHLPGTSGLDLLPRLRARTPDLHIIMLTGAATEADRVRGLVSGADDYVVKPFSQRELAARVIAVQRRQAVSAPANIQAGGLEIDMVARRVRVDGRDVDVTRRELDLLGHLAAHPGRSFTREELLRAVWGSSAAWQSEATVTEHVRRLRSKVEADPARPARLVTVRGAGYRFEPAADDGERQPAQPVAEGRIAPDPGRAASVVIADDLIVKVNQAALALVGASDEREVLGQHFLRFLAPRSHGTPMARRESAKRGSWARPEVISLLRLDGAEALVELSSAPVLWNERPASLVTLWDLEGDTAKLRELATGIHTDLHEAVIVTDAELRIQSFSSAAEELYGHREADVIGQPMGEVLQCGLDGPGGGATIEDLLRDARWNGELAQRRLDGTPLVVRMSATLLRDDLGRPTGVVCVNRPVEPSAPGPAAGDPGALLDDLRTGIERGELRVHYLPVVRLDGTGWGGVEALVRWQHPTQGLLGPAHFLPLVEEHGLVDVLGQLVLEQTCRQWSSWRRAGRDLHVSVNISGRELADPSLPDRVEAAMAEAAMPPDRLWFEVTESTLVEDLKGGAGTLRRLAEVGAAVSVDDFGTGWSSLAYLREAPVRALKIDPRFTRGLGTDLKDTAIVASVVALGHELELTVIAEGIETPEQARLLGELGCELGQGYLYGMPQPPDQLALPVEAAAV